MNLFTLVAKLGLDTDEYESKVSKVRSAAVSTAKAIGVGIGAASTAVATLTGLAVKGYAEQEQLVGGVETLFKESADKVEAYANRAYKTAGLSANKYMETVTGFSASLLQSLGGDTEKAAAQADKAVTDMSDNANKMGTDMKSIQFAYQGFAKQNYTMLDNLKLGYGGTQEEMKRLLADAGKLAGQEFDISSYSDVIDAIHIIQEEMGITGTTAKEASETISGSFSSMKSAWSNLMTGMASGDKDIIRPLITEMVDSAKTFGENIIPVIEETLNGIILLIQELFPVVMAEFPRIIHDTLPQVLDAAVGIITSLVKGLSDNKQAVFSTIFTIIKTLIQTVVELLPEIIALGVDLIVAFIDGITQDPGKLISAIITVIETLLNAIFDNFPKLVEAGLKLVVALVEGIIANLPRIFSVGAELIGKLVSGLGDVLWQAVKAGGDIVSSIWDGIVGAWDDLTSWFNSLWDGLFGRRNVQVDVSHYATSRPNGSHAGGLAHVPFDGYIAELHRGERVLTAKEADSYNRRGSTISGVEININAVDFRSADEIADAVAERLQAMTDRREAVYA